MAKSFKEQLAQLTPEQVEDILGGLTDQEIIEMGREEWWYTQRPEQVPPDGPWTIHMYLGGRGTGKTKSGAEWLVQRCLDFPYTEAGHPAARLVVADNLSDTRTTCIEGDSGILTVLHRRGYKLDENYTYLRSPKPCITLLDTGTRIHFTGADPNAIRGFNLADVWMDEPVKWDYPEIVWKEGIYPALRSALPGDKPRAFVTTTPKPIKFIQDMAKRFEKPGNKFVSMSRGSTFDNAANLSAEFIEEVAAEYEGTALGRQELYGELLDDIVGPLFSFGVIERNRRPDIPADVEIEHITVGVDPCLTGGEEGDFMGVVVVGRGTDKHLYVFADETVKKTGREAAVHIWKTLSTYKADTVVVESNLGKQWLKEVLERTYVELADTGFFPKWTTAPLSLIHSNHGKKLRAEPVALRYQQNRVHHMERFEKLESEMITFDPIKSQASPDRLDALVHACRHLMEGEAKPVRIFSPVKRKIPGM